MRAMALRRFVSLEGTEVPLEPVEMPLPVAGPGEVLLKVLACGVCHTELDEIEGRTPPAELPVVPGHEVVGRVERRGRGVTGLREGDRVGVGWIFSSTGGREENLSPAFRATGRDVNGGYAQYMVAREGYAHRVPDAFSDAEAAPLLCAGAVGFRALRLSGITNGDPIGLTGFGGSAHLVLQVIRHRFPGSPVYVFARDPAGRAFALELGASWAGDTGDRSPEALQAIIDTTPGWRPVVEALANLRPGGRLVINAIRKEDRDKDSLLGLSYPEHLWLERELKSVANVTARDLAEFLPLAAEIPLRPQVTRYGLQQANEALLNLKRGGVKGANVLVID